MIFITVCLSPHPPSCIKYYGSIHSRHESLEIVLIIIMD